MAKRRWREKAVSMIKEDFLHIRSPKGHAIKTIF